MLRLLTIAAIAGCVAPTASDHPRVDEAPVAFGFPLPERARFGVTVGFDHDPVEHTGTLGIECVAFDGAGFPACYDQHDGTDFLLDGGFDAMDAGSSPIVAAADGVVVATHDGEYDRCHVEGSAVSCDGYEMKANQVTVEHAGGGRSLYWHMKSGSVRVQVGDAVACGDPLGLVGSSGNSSTPHLHFEVEDATGVPVDPFAGPYSQEVSWWEEQEAADGLPGAGCAAP